MFVGWSGHSNYSLNSDRVGLKTVCSDNMIHEGCLADKKFHFVNVQLNVMLLEPHKYSNEVSVVVNSGFSISSAATWD